MRSASAPADERVRELRARISDARAELTVRARPEPAYVIGIRPAPGATIFPDGKVVVVFNRDPGDVQCEGGRLDPDGQVGTVRTYRMEWGGTISFAWPDDGSLTVAYSPLGCVGEGGGGRWSP